jgi:2-iminobutanoate/2-iminopropanoate deaminase
MQAPPAGVAAPGPTSAPSAAPFSAAVLAGNTLYVSGAIDLDPATGKLGATPEESAKVVLDAVKAAVTGAGMTMDDLVWVQVFCSDLSYYAAFNEVYRTYFKGPLPARAFLGVDHLLGGAHFEVMGVAVRSK